MSKKNKTAGRTSSPAEDISRADEGADTERTPRDLATREQGVIVDSWSPASNLPVPDPVDGYVFRWVRTEMLGDVDNRNVSKRFREGWVPVVREDHPELGSVLSDHGSNWAAKGNIEVGGQLLCKAPVEMVDARNAHYLGLALGQVQAIEAQLMGQSDSRMPIVRPHIKSRVSQFGRDG